MARRCWSCTSSIPRRKLSTPPAPGRQMRWARRSSNWTSFSSPENDVVELRGGHEQQTPLDGSAGHLHEGSAFWDETQFATHAQEESENGRRFFHSTSNFLPEPPSAVQSSPARPFT